jgi:NADH:ubiquinone oxidoreductase subunit 2 (subunit N)
MLAEILNLRKWIAPVLVLGLAVIFGLNLMDWNQNQSYFNDMLRVDNFSVGFGALAIFTTLLVLIMASDFYQNDQNHISDFMAIITFILVGALMMLSFANLTMLFLGIETLSIALYIMAGSKRFDIRSNEAGFKYFLMGSFASAFLLFGIALIFGTSGSFNIYKIADFEFARIFNESLISKIELIYNSSSLCNKIFSVEFFSRVFDKLMLIISFNKLGFVLINCALPVNASSFKPSALLIKSAMRIPACNS